MAEIIDLDPLTTANDADVLVIYDVSEGANNSKRITRENFLAGVARDGGDHDFGTSEIAALTTQNASIGFTDGATLTKAMHASASPTFGSISADTGETQTVSLTGAATTDQLTWAFTEAIPDGMITQAWISAPDTVSIRLFNTGSSPIAGASYGMRLTALRFA